MNGSWRAVTVRGTEVKIHFTFPLLLLLRGWQHYQEGGAAAALHAVVVLLTLFLCVLLHEFGHIGMARRFGIRTPDVLLLPIGGVARLERMPEEPKQELLIALAGPAVTLAIAVGLYLVILAGGQPIELERSLSGQGPFLTEIMAINAFLLVFNLIPAFPMDGGRVLRSLLAFRLGLPRATRIAARLGQGLAVAAALYGLFSTPSDIWLVLIGVFVFFGAGAELAGVEQRAMARDVPLGDVMLTTFQTIPIHARLEAAAELLGNGDQQEFPVVDNLGRVEGLLTREHLRQGLAVHGSAGTVEEAMAPRVPALAPELPFRLALERLKASGLPALPVLNAAGVLVGMLTLRQVNELLLLTRTQRA